MQETISLILLIILSTIISVVYIKGIYCESKRWLKTHKKKEI